MRPLIGQGDRVLRRPLFACFLTGRMTARCPLGIFYAQGVKANVLFFDRKTGQKNPWTTKLWVYDLRTNEHFTLKQNPMTRKSLDEFVECYRAGERHKRKPTWSEKTPEGRWRAYGYDEILARDKVSLDKTSQSAAARSR